MDIDPEEGVMLRLNWTSLNTQIHWTALFVSFSLPYIEAHVRYDLAILTCMIWSRGSFLSFLYDINLWATHTMILCTRGFKIPIYLVSSTTDSIRRCIVLLKTVTIPTLDLKSEFLCQSSLCCAEPADPLNHLVCLGYLPCLHSPRIIPTLRVQVLSPST